MAIRHAVAQSCKERLEHPAGWNADGHKNRADFDRTPSGGGSGGSKEPGEEKKKIVVPALATHYATGGGWLVFVGVDFRWSRLFCTF